jgi:hypothetical protein
MKQIAFIIFSLLFLFAIAQEPTPAQVVETQLHAYNSGDIDRFMSVFSEDITLWNLGDTIPWATGYERVKEVYKHLFDASPNLHSTVVNRSIIGNKVIDYERIIGRNSGDVLNLVMIYEVRDGKIFRATAVRE